MTEFGRLYSQTASDVAPIAPGLNLTACNNVILVDMWWNPALEDQAFDRAHRLGQTRDVHIYKLTIENTVEQRILALQDGKRALAAAALSGDRIKTSSSVWKTSWHCSDLGRDTTRKKTTIEHDDHPYYLLIPISRSLHTLVTMLTTE